jgi:hypothetical protein
VVLELFPTCRCSGCCCFSWIDWRRRRRTVSVRRTGRRTDGGRSHIVIEVRRVPFLDEIALLWLILILCSGR